MILLLHILVALSSLIFSTLLFFYPTKLKLRVSYSLVVLTLTSGVYLVINSHSNLVQSCVSGLIYIGVVSVAIVSARRKLAI